MGPEVKRKNLQTSLEEDVNQFNKAKTSFGDQKILSNVSLSAFVLDLRAGPDDRVMT